MRDPQGDVSLIDWDVAGLGVALIDFGAVLSDCFAYPAELMTVDAGWVEAAVDAYVEHRPLTCKETNLVPDAIRFGVAHRTAVRFAMSEAAGWSDYMRRGLAHEQARLSVSGEIAEVAAVRIAASPGWSIWWGGLSGI